jgi:hypothetical protein
VNPEIFDRPPDLPATAIAGLPDATRAGADPGLATRIARTFFSPARLFVGFHDGTPWLGVLAISTLVAMIAAPFIPAEHFLARMEDPVNRLGRPVEVTSSPEEIVRWGRYLEAFSALAAHPLIAFGLAGLLLLVFTVLGRGRGTFRQYLAVASHALLIPALGALVAIALRVSTGDFTAQPTVARLLGFIAPGVAGNAFLDGLNVFSLWMLVVLGVAVAVLDGRTSWMRPAAALVTIYLLLAGATVLIAS